MCLVLLPATAGKICENSAPLPSALLLGTAIIYMYYVIKLLSSVFFIKINAKKFSLVVGGWEIW